MAKNKLLVICGPTAVGKTGLGVKLAKKFNGELLSADSRQVYQGMNIGTGKDQPKEMIIHLLDVVNPDERFDVSQYYALATKKIKEIWQQEKLPILVGGTGFYIKALVDGLGTMGAPPDWELRKELEVLSVGELQARLKKLAPEKWQQMNQSDSHNPRRLIRAIEIAKNKAKIRHSPFAICHSLFVGLKVSSNKLLYQRIDQRVNKRVEQGIVKEIQGLLKKGFSWENSVLGTTLGYREFQLFFERKKSLEETIQAWKFNEHNYARRQMTWFRKEKRIHWFNITQPDFKNEVVEFVKKWYIKSNEADKS